MPPTKGKFFIKLTLFLGREYYEPSSKHYLSYLPPHILFGMLSFVGHTQVRPFKRLGYLLCGPQSVPMQAYPLCDPCSAALGRHLIHLQRRLVFPLHCCWTGPWTVVAPDLNISGQRDCGLIWCGLLLDVLGLMSAL